MSKLLKFRNLPDVVGVVMNGYAKPENLGKYAMMGLSQEVPSADDLGKPMQLIVFAVWFVPLGQGYTILGMRVRSKDEGSYVAERFKANDFSLATKECTIVQVRRPFTPVKNSFEIF